MLEVLDVSLPLPGLLEDLVEHCRGEGPLPMMRSHETVRLRK